MAIRIGISGWRYAPWRGVFYPRELPQRRELEYAAHSFASIELNGSFYSLQSPRSWATWAGQVPREFVFAVKGPRYVTHMLRLRDTGAALANFFASGVLLLGPHLGPLLWQLPPSMRYDHDLLDAFLGQLPRDTDAALSLARGYERRRMKGRVALPPGPRRRLRHALEIRHESFDDPGFIRLLRRHRVALVVSDTPGRFPYAEDVTAGFVYLRLHGDTELYRSGYGDEALDRWAARIRRWADGGEPDDARRFLDAPPPRAKRRDVYCYFDNDAKVRAPVDAQALYERLAR
ncbi:DUF72 domain-containing protein [Pseudoxanthomonas suwonensis]|uniref:DUF72 domain-containing protein n=1 Tax=Pseudoxanthomonas suwonensis TaxID=314722 RepID=UPI00138F7DA1|nr:DUF72 domain-containing protein [Pseudoxanthomonas suwonensis]KAF1702528.1 hypothetical protein CSC68_06430 [Pseudoxanthomonas suwonensis]